MNKYTKITVSASKQYQTITLEVGLDENDNLAKAYEEAKTDAKMLLDDLILTIDGPEDEKAEPPKFEKPKPVVKSASAGQFKLLNDILGGSKGNLPIGAINTLFAENTDLYAKYLERTLTGQEITEIIQTGFEAFGK